jgi:hypothetical protein
MKHYEYEISLFVEDELPPDKKEGLLLHLSSCKKCSKVLADYQKIKYNISDFYETLPSRNIYITPIPDKTNIIRRIVSRRILIPVSVFVLIFIAVVSFIEHGSHQPEINSTANVSKEVTEKEISNGKIDPDSFDYLNIKEFNKVINNTILFKENLDRELRNTSYSYELVEFNKVINNEIINGAFYNNYN